MIHRLILKEEIDRSMFDKFNAKFVAKKLELVRKTETSGIKVSNLDLCIENAITLSSKLASL